MRPSDKLITQKLKESAGFVSDYSTVSVDQHPSKKGVLVVFDSSKVVGEIKENGAEWDAFDADGKRSGSYNEKPSAWKALVDNFRSQGKSIIK